MLKLMYITPDPVVAEIAMTSGVDRIFIDMEILGKSDRQAGMNTVQSMHTIDDIRAIKQVMQSGRELLVRSNPIHSGLQSEIDDIIAAGADIVMLPYFQTADQVQQFVNMVGGRAKCSLLVESREAFENIDSILEVAGVDEYHIGLNDLHLDYGMKFMFEPLINGMLDSIVAKLRLTGKSYGFGGIARVGEGTLPAENIIIEHYRLGSSCAIVSRGFCNTSIITDYSQIRDIFTQGIAKIRDLEASIDGSQFEENHKKVESIINTIVNAK